jgi:hypothetical protein
MVYILVWYFLVFHVIVNSHFVCFQRRCFRVSSQQKIESQNEGPNFMLSLVVTVSRRSSMSLFRCFRAYKSNKS